MHGIAERIEAGEDIERDGGISMPGIRRGNGHELGPGARPVYAHALCVWAKMPPARQTIAAMPAGDVTFADDEIALGESADIAADAINFADELVTDRYRDRDGFLRPRIPVVNMNIGPADRCFERVNEDVV